jgi:hypothetical protein
MGERDGVRDGVGYFDCTDAVEPRSNKPIKLPWIVKTLDTRSACFQTVSQLTLLLR